MLFVHLSQGGLEGTGLFFSPLRTPLEDRPWAHKPAKADLGTEPNAVKHQKSKTHFLPVWAMVQGPGLPIITFFPEIDLFLPKSGHFGHFFSVFFSLTRYFFLQRTAMISVQVCPFA